MSWVGWLIAIVLVAGIVSLGFHFSTVFKAGITQLKNKFKGL